jgi:hypothetical protein
LIGIAGIHLNYRFDGVGCVLIEMASRCVDIFAEHITLNPTNELDIKMPSFQCHNSLFDRNSFSFFTLTMQITAVCYGGTITEAFFKEILFGPISMQHVMITLKIMLF